MTQLLAQSVPLNQEFFRFHGGSVFSQGPAVIISKILPNAMVLAGVIFFIMIIFYGWDLLIGAGQSRSAQEIARSKNIFTYSIIGFLLVVSAYFILQIIGFITGVNFTNLPI